MLLGDLPRTPGIYKIVHAATGRVYVGSAVDLLERARLHRNLLNRNNHTNRHLQSAWSKYGPDAFWFSVVEHVEEPKNLIAIETRIIAEFDATNSDRGFNFCKTGRSALGLKRSAETREKMRLKQVGKPMHPNARAALIAHHTGKKQSVETVQRRIARLIKYTPVVIDGWIARINSGETHTAIAKSVGMARTNFSRLIRSRGKRSFVRIAVTDELKTRIRELRSSGLSYTKIGALLACDKATAKKYSEVTDG